MLLWGGPRSIEGLHARTSLREHPLLPGTVDRSRSKRICMQRYGGCTGFGQLLPRRDERHQPRLALRHRRRRQRYRSAAAARSIDPDLPAGSEDFARDLGWRNQGFEYPVPPRTDSSTIASLIAILVLGIGASLLAVTLARRRSRIFLIVLAAAAALNVLTQVVTRALPSAILDRMMLGVIASLFGLDGEYAFDAAGYELWLEIWLSLALIACVIARAVRHGTLTRTS